MNEFLVPEFEPGDDKEYEIEDIQDGIVYAKEIDRHLLGLYYLIAWKGYPEEKSTWEPFLAIIYLRKMVTTFHKDHPEKSIVTLASLDSAPPMTRPKVMPTDPLKQKQGRLIGRTKERAKWGDKEEATKKRRQGRGDKNECELVRF